MIKKGYTLIEILLSVSLVIVFAAVCVFNMSSLWNSKTVLDSKVEQFITLSRYVKANAELSGKKSSILIETNKIKVIQSNSFLEITNNIPVLQSQIEDLNNDTFFESGDFINTNIVTVVTYLPDGSIEKYGTVGIRIDNEELWITISEWNKVEIKNTNTVCVEEDF